MQSNEDTERKIKALVEMHEMESRVHERRLEKWRAEREARRAQWQRQRLGLAVIEH